MNDISTILREALAWGYVMEPVIPTHQWNQAREEKLAQLLDRLDGKPPLIPCAIPFENPPLVDITAETARARAYIAGMPNVIEWAPIGSATYMPADQVNDVDFAVLIDGKALDYLGNMQALHGWSSCSEYDTSEGEFKWGAMRMGNWNFMITHDRGFYERYKTATEVCKALKLTDKAQRIAVCQIVRDGKTAAEVTV